MTAKPMTAKVVAATLLCDRKVRSQLVGIPAMLQIQGIDRLYINIESNLRGAHFEAAYQPLRDFLRAGTFI